MQPKLICLFRCHWCPTLESFCPELQSIGGFWDEPEYRGAMDIFTRKHSGWNESLPDLGENCEYFSNIAESFHLDQCFDIQISFMVGMWLVTAAVVMAYFSSLMLTYPGAWMFWDEITSKLLFVIDHRAGFVVAAVLENREMVDRTKQLMKLCTMK